MKDLVRAAFYFNRGEQRPFVVELCRSIYAIRTEKMFPAHLSVNDLGVFYTYIYHLFVFAVVMVLGLIVVRLFMFDFVSKLMSANYKTTFSFYLQQPLIFITFTIT